MDGFTWLTIAISTCMYFGFLFALKKLGKKVLAITWIPWRAIYLAIIWAINDDSHTRDESVQAAYASVFYAVCFIISVHYTFPFFVKENMTVKNGCGTLYAWLLSLLVLGGTFTLTYFSLETNDPNWALGMGSLGLILNACHLYFFHHRTAAHEYLDPKHITYTSIGLCTATAFVVLTLIAFLSDFGLHKLSGILYNFPLMIILTVGSLGCKHVETKFKNLYDFIYILLHNVFVGNVFLGWYWYFIHLGWSDAVNIIIASVVTLSIALVMYLYVFRIGLEGKGGQDFQKMSTDQTTVASASAPYRSSRNFTSYRHRPQNTFVRF